MIAEPSKPDQLVVEIIVSRAFRFHGKRHRCLFVRGSEGDAILDRLCIRADKI